MNCFWSTWFSILRLQSSLILTICLPGSQTIKNASSSCALKRIVGGSAQLQLNSYLGPNVREIEWYWDSENEEERLLVSWNTQMPNPNWYDLGEKYQHRFNLTEMTLLSIKNLTMEMSGLYKAKIKFSSGKFQEESFSLCLYEPVPYPKIQIHSISSTSGWCNLGLECETPGTTENLTVTWLSKGLLKELEQRGTLGSASQSRNLRLSLPLSQLDGHLTCVVSNPAQEQNATLYLESVCPQKGSLQNKWLWKGIIPLVLIVSLGTGLWIWMRKKMKNGRGKCWEDPEGSARMRGLRTTPQALPEEESADLPTGETNSHEFPYAEIVFLRHPETDMEKYSCYSDGPKGTAAVHSIYKKIPTSPEPPGNP